jgi:hypothetical protein
MQPNFLIPGAAKSGTTSLYEYLKQHPDVFMPDVKEPTYFVSSYLADTPDENPRKKRLMSYLVTDYRDYEALFEGVTTEKAIGEASVYYLYYWKQAIPAIKSTLGDVKIIISLRNPVDRAYSSYLNVVKDGDEDCTFEQSLHLEDQREQAGWRTLLYQYRKPGLYADQVAAYLQHFSSVKVILYDDFKNDPVGVAKECCEFLGVDGEAISENRLLWHNSSLKPRNALVDKALFKPNRIRSDLNTMLGLVLGEKRRVAVVRRVRKSFAKRRPMRADTRAALNAYFREDIDKLSDLIQRDLSHWR